LRVGLKGLRRFVRLVGCLVIDGCELKHAEGQGRKNTSGLESWDENTATQEGWVGPESLEEKTMMHCLQI
jgi:hypothetical protein